MLYCGHMSDMIQNENGSRDESLAFSEIPFPPQCTVIFYNDDYTTKDFVVDVLVGVFNKPRLEAEQIMESVHNTGSGVVGSYTYDIAVSRTNITKNLAKKNGFPLRVEIEHD